MNHTRASLQLLTALCFSGGVEPARPPRKKSAKNDDEGGDGAAEGGVSAPKPGGKKRGRPPKTAYMAGAGGVPHFAPNMAALAHGAVGAAAHGSLVGSRVEGIVDGAFDVGYFLTVRISGTNQVPTSSAIHAHTRPVRAVLRLALTVQHLRAIVFRPELCVGGQVRRRRWLRCAARG